MDRYYVVQAQPQKERLAVQELQNQRFLTFFPVIQRAPKVVRGKLDDGRQSPMFPKYLFVQFDLETCDNWRSINGTRGVTRLMCMDEWPSAVPVFVMNRLIAAGEVVLEETATLPFNLGDNVEFTAGAFAGKRGLVQACDAERVEVLLSLLGTQVPVRVTPGSLTYVPT